LSRPNSLLAIRISYLRYLTVPTILATVLTYPTTHSPSSPSPPTTFPSSTITITLLRLGLPGHTACPCRRRSCPFLSTQSLITTHLSFHKRRFSRPLGPLETPVHAASLLYVFSPQAIRSIVLYRQCLTRLSRIDTNPVLHGVCLLPPFSSPPSHTESLRTNCRLPLNDKFNHTLLDHLPRVRAQGSLRSRPSLFVRGSKKLCGDYRREITPHLPLLTRPLQFLLRRHGRSCLPSL